MLEKIHIEQFTAFDKLILNFSPGINIFVGENGTGKTHLMKVLYAACDVTKTQGPLAEKIKRVFLPSGERIGRLIKRIQTGNKGFFEISRKLLESDKSLSLRLSFSHHARTADNASLSGAYKQWPAHPLESVYIPVKEMMANAPGFRSLYNLRSIHFEEVYADIIDRVFLDPLRGPADSGRKQLLKILQNAMDGKVIRKNEEFFLKNKQGQLEFTLLAEGIRKLGLLWVLIQNGTLLKGSVLFWDEPEANLNPCLMRTVVQILLELQRMGVQIFLATHDYTILKEFDLQLNARDQVLFHCLYRDAETKEIQAVSDSAQIRPNAIDDTFAGLVDREIQRSMQGLGQRPEK